MVEEVCASADGRHVGGVRKQAQLVAEVGAANDGAGDDARVGTDGTADPHEHDPDSAGAARGRARERGENGRDGESEGVDPVRIDEARTPVDKHGNGAGNHPGADQQPIANRMKIAGSALARRATIASSMRDR